MIEKEITYSPTGVCSQCIKINVVEDENTDKENGIIKNVLFVGGCPGNALGLARALEGKDVKSVIGMLKDIKCGIKDTSCPAQLAQALESYIND